jgi:membrane protease subunit HflK
LKELSDKLASLFKQALSGRAFMLVMLSLLCIILLLWLSSGYFVLQTQQIARISALGRPMRVLTQSGLHWHLPYPFAQHEVLAIQHSAAGATVGNDLLLSQDAYAVEVHYQIEYSIQNPQAYFASQSIEASDIDGRLDTLVQQDARPVIRQLNLHDLLLKKNNALIVLEKNILAGAAQFAADGIAIGKISLTLKVPNSLHASMQSLKKQSDKNTQILSALQDEINFSTPQVNLLAEKIEQTAEENQQVYLLAVQAQASRLQALQNSVKQNPALTQVVVQHNAGMPRLAPLPDLMDWLKQMPAVSAASSVAPVSLVKEAL